MSVSKLGRFFSATGRHPVRLARELLRRLVRDDDRPSHSGQRPGRRCNTLKDGAGKVIASAKPSAGQPQLNLGFLRMRYAIGRAAHRNDYLDATGRDHVADARECTRCRSIETRSTATLVPDEQGRLWLQYWLFYYYNDKAFMGIGLHEGDWEMVQLRLDQQNKPNVLTYSQHLEGARTSWANVVRAMTTDGPVPVVFSARGSHACYFRPGSTRRRRSYRTTTMRKGCAYDLTWSSSPPTRRRGCAGRVYGEAHGNATSWRAPARAAPCSTGTGRIRTSSITSRARLRTALPGCGRVSRFRRHRRSPSIGTPATR